MSGAPTSPKTITPLRLFATLCVLAPTVAVIAQYAATIRIPVSTTRSSWYQ
jgi:hypothetical protein